MNINKIKILNDNYEFLIDNDDYIDLHDSPQQYLISYSYIHPLTQIASELIKLNIEFSHHLCPISDESYLLINKKQFTNLEIQYKTY